MRSKEESHDYRYFPDPDLLPMVFTDDYLNALRASLPELPADRRARFITAYGLPEYDARILTAEKALADFVDQTVTLGAPAKTVSNWIMGELMRLLNEKGIAPHDSPVSAQSLATLINLVEQGKINANQAKQVFTEIFETGKAPEQIVKERGFRTDIRCQRTGYHHRRGARRQSGGGGTLCRRRR